MIPGKGFNATEQILFCSASLLQSCFAQVRQDMSRTMLLCLTGEIDTERLSLQRDLPSSMPQVIDGALDDCFARLDVGATSILFLAVLSPPLGNLYAWESWEDLLVFPEDDLSDGTTLRLELFRNLDSEK